MKIFITLCLAVVVLVQSTPLYKEPDERVAKFVQKLDDAVLPESDSLEKKGRTGEESKEYDVETAIPEDEEFPEFLNSDEYIDDDERDHDAQEGENTVGNKNNQERDVIEDGLEKESDQPNSENIYEDEITSDDAPVAVSDHAVEEAEDRLGVNQDKDVTDAAALNFDEQGNDGSEELNDSEVNDQESEEQLNESEDEEDTSHAQLEFLKSKMDALASPEDTEDGPNEQEIINDVAESPEQNKVMSDPGINEERTKTSDENNAEEDSDFIDELTEDEESEDVGNVKDNNLEVSDNAEEDDGKLDDGLSKEYEDDDDDM